MWTTLRVDAQGLRATRDSFITRATRAVGPAGRETVYYTPGHELPRPEGFAISNTDGLGTLAADIAWSPVIRTDLGHSPPSVRYRPTAVLLMPMRCAMARTDK